MVKSLKELNLEDDFLFAKVMIDKDICKEFQIFYANNMGDISSNNKKKKKEKSNIFYIIFEYYNQITVIQIIK